MIFYIVRPRYSYFGTNINFRQLPGYTHLISLRGIYSFELSFGENQGWDFPLLVLRVRDLADSPNERSVVRADVTTEQQIILSSLKQQGTCAMSPIDVANAIAATGVMQLQEGPRMVVVRPPPPVTQVVNSPTGDAVTIFMNVYPIPAEMQQLMDQDKANKAPWDI